MNYTAEYKYYKSVINSHVWNYNKHGRSSSLYVKKWRIDDPKSSFRIKVTIKSVEEFQEEINYSEMDILNNPILKKEPIVVNVKYYEEKTKTIRYKIISEIKPFESIYIPTFMLGDFKNKDIVQVRVDWF